MESRIHGDMYVRFGGRHGETSHRNVVWRPVSSLHIPAYVFFLNQERYTSYLQMREMWATVSALLNNENPPNKD